MQFNAMSHAEPCNLWDIPDTAGATDHSTQHAYGSDPGNAAGTDPQHVESAPPPGSVPASDYRRMFSSMFPQEAPHDPEHAADEVKDSEAEFVVQGNLHQSKANKIAAYHRLRLPRKTTENALQCAPSAERTSQASGSTDATPPTHTIGIWQMQFPKQWTEYEPETNAHIEQQFRSGMQLAHVRQCRSKKNDEWDDYTISFDRMEQLNIRSKRVRKVRRIERTVPKHDELSEKRELTGVWKEENNE